MVNIANVLLMLGVMASIPVNGEVLFYHDFDDDELGPYTLDDLKDHWGTRNASNSLKNRATVEIIEDPNRTHGKVMSVFFKSGEYGYNSAGYGSGTQWMTPVGSREELYLSYDIMFEQGFDFALGGKLPGLFGGKFIGGGKKPTGYDGWSGRMMFHPNGKMIQYVYHAGMPSAYGHKFPWGIKNRKYFMPGKWHTVKMRYVMNTPGIANGIIQAWFDGELVLDSRKFLFRHTESISITGLIVTTYFGGHKQKWASPKDQHIFFDKFMVSTQPTTR